MADELRSRRSAGAGSSSAPGSSAPSSSRGARIRMLVAGSGYGKTVLLEQWAPRDGRSRRLVPRAPLRHRRGGGGPWAGGCGGDHRPGRGSRMLERLGITQDPEREAVLLARDARRGSRRLARRGLLVIDDYHHLAGVRGVRAVRGDARRARTGAAPPREPRAADRGSSPRSILSGAVLEIPQSVLAMSADEAELVLDGARVETPRAGCPRWRMARGGRSRGDGARRRGRRLAIAGGAVRALRRGGLPRSRPRRSARASRSSRRCRRRSRARGGRPRRGTGGAICDEASRSA